MFIGNISPQHNTNYQSNYMPHEIRAESSIKTSNSNDVVISQKGKEAENIWQKVAAKYDVTSISANERVALSNELNEAGLMPMQAMIYMVAPTSTNMNPNEKMNYLDIAKKSLEFERAAGINRQQEIIREKAIGLMEHIKMLRNI